MEWMHNFTAEGVEGNWRARLEVANDAVLVGHVARFDPIKRHHDLIEAARLLRQQAPEVVIALVGQGELHEEIRELAHECDNVRFVRDRVRRRPSCGLLTYSCSARGMKPRP